MINAAVKMLTVAAVCSCGFRIHLALAQDAEQKGGTAGYGPVSAAERAPAGAERAPAGSSGREPPASVDDQIIVRGRSRAELRAEIERAEDAFYDRFNEINSNDEFDIHCREEVPINSHIPRRRCEANFWREAESGFGQAELGQLRGEAVSIPQAFLAEGYHKDGLMAEELKRLLAQDPELQRALARFGSLEEQEEHEDSAPRAPSETVSAQATSDQKPLPYDAALEADVRIGREPWSHALTQRTFAVAHLYGEIRKMNLKCRSRKERIRYNANAEWTLPADWAPCTLTVKASPGTTFSLFEFK